MFQGLIRRRDAWEAGVFTDRVGELTTDFFQAVTSMECEWRKNDEVDASFTLTDRDTRRPVHQTTRNDLLLGSNQQLRAVAEVYAGSDGQPRFVRDFVAVRDKATMADRYDVKAGWPIVVIGMKCGRSVGGSLTGFTDGPLPDGL